MRKTVCIILTISLLFALFAIASNAASETPPIQYGVETTFLLSIPDVITATNAEEEKNIYSMTLSDVKIPHGTELKVKATYNNTLKLTDETSIKLDYNLWVDEETDWKLKSGDMIIKVPSDVTGEKTVNFYGLVETNPIFSGTYTGTVMFQVLIEDMVTDFSPTDIEDDSHIYGIGESDNNFVVAVFNDDFSSVVITKNGTDSDGAMKNWSESEVQTDNPFILHKDTLRTVDIKSGVTSVGARTFLECDNLEQEIALPNTVESVGTEAFKGCKNIISLDFGDGVKSIGKDSFNGCSGLSGSLNLGGTTEFIGERAFANLDGITALNFGDNIGFIGTGAFENCTGIANEIVFPESLYAIGDYAFSELTSATNTEIVLPDSVEHIGGTSFNKPTSGFDTIETNSRLGTVTHADYNAIAFEEGDDGYDKDGYTVDNYKTAKYAETGSGVFLNFGANSYNWSVNSSNSSFKAVNGVLYSKSGTRLIDCDNREMLEIPEGVEFIDEQAFSKVKTLTIPDTYKIQTYPDAPVTQKSFKNTLTAALGDNSPLTKLVVKGTNTNYKVVNNSLYSADGTVCYNLWLNTDGEGTINEGCERCEGIMASVDWYKIQENFSTYTLNIPASVNFISNYDSTTYENRGDIAVINALVDNTEKPLTVNIASDNTVYEIDTDGHITLK